MFEIKYLPTNQRIQRKLLMAICLLQVNKYPFHLNKDDEELIGYEVSYFNAISAFEHIKHCTQPYIALFVILLANYNSAQIIRH